MIDRLEAEFSRRLLRFERSRGYETDGAVSTVSWLRGRCNLSGPAAAQRVEVARVLPDLPETERAFRRGDIGFQHAAVLARTATELGTDRARSAEATLVDAAHRLDPGRLRLVTRHLRHCVDPNGALDAADHDHESRRLHISQTFDGVFILDGLLDGEGGALVRTALNALSNPAQGDTRTGAQRRADALVEIAARQLQSGELPNVAGERPHVTMPVTTETLRREPGSSAGDINGAGPVVADMARRLACDAGLTTVMVDAGGNALNVGRATRTVPAAIRRALALRDRGCRFPGCDRAPEWTDGHHLRHWSDGGDTSLENLVLLCRRHHRAVHEGGWTLKRGDDGRFLAAPP